MQRVKEQLTKILKVYPMLMQRVKKSKQSANGASRLSWGKAPTDETKTMVREHGKNNCGKNNNRP